MATPDTLIHQKPTARTMSMDDCYAVRDQFCTKNGIGYCPHRTLSKEDLKWVKSVCFRIRRREKEDRCKKDTVKYAITRQKGNARRQKTHEENRETDCGYAKRYREENPELVKANARKCYKKHSEEYAKNSLERHYENDSDETKEQRAQYRDKRRDEQEVHVRYTEMLTWWRC